MTNSTPWLKAMENEGLGEARAKAFLMDRFWVLERSVDVEGTDYLVQRRLTAHNFIDRDPSRLGIVHVKFLKRFPKNAKMASAIQSWNRLFRRGPGP